MHIVEDFYLSCASCHEESFHLEKGSMMASAFSKSRCWSTITDMLLFLPPKKCVGMAQVPPVVGCHPAGGIHKDQKDCDLPVGATGAQCGFGGHPHTICTFVYPPGLRVRVPPYQGWGLANKVIQASC